MSDALPRWNGERVKGSTIRAHIDWVREHASREETIEFFEMLPPDVRRLVAIVMPYAWYEATTLRAIDRTIVAMFGDREDDLEERLAACR